MKNYNIEWMVMIYQGNENIDEILENINTNFIHVNME